MATDVNINPAVISMMPASTDFQVFSMAYACTGEKHGNKACSFSFMFLIPIICPLYIIVKHAIISVVSTDLVYFK
jgi:hypothetical protein